jgi:hypothetical protein
MKDYLRSSLRQLYLLYFWPTQFAREVEGESHGRSKLQYKARARYMLKMLPWVVLISVFANLVVWFICEALGLDYSWISWVAVVVGVAAGAAFGVLVSAAFGTAFGALVGVLIIMAYGVNVSKTFGKPNAVFIILALGVMFGAVLGVASSMTSGMTSGMVSGMTSTLAFGVAVGVAVGSVLGIQYSVAFGAEDSVRGGGVVFGSGVSVGFWLFYFRLISYPIHASLSLITYLAGKRNPQAIKKAWRLCPVIWNEVIWPPLPFAAKLLIMLTRQDREEGFRQITFVAAERRRQKRVALRASVEIALSDLRATSINHLADVTQNLEWTTDAPAELPEVLVSAFPRFERTAQHAGQYLTLHSDHRKGEALKQALAELAGLQKSLIVARGRLALRLLQTANEWDALLKAEQMAFAAKLTEAREISNPFAFGNALGETKDNVFVGRQDIVRKIEDSILGTNQTPTLLLQGARRMGKSSILNQLPRMLGPDFAPVVIDCQEAAIRESTAATLRYLSRAIATGLQRQRVKVNPLSRQALEREPFSVFKDWLEDVERVWPKGLRVLLCFDEYERLQETLDAGWGHGFLDTLRNWIQHHPHLVLMFTGAHAFEELGPAWTDRFISARRMRVSFLAREDLELLLTRPIPEFDLTYGDGALDAIIHTTNGQPFLTQAVAFELVQHLNEQHRKEATPEDVEAAIAQALVSGSAYFHNVWSDAREPGQAILIAVARNEPPPDYPAARVWLLENDVLNEAGDFAVPMVRRWVSETRVQ